MPTIAELRRSKFLTQFELAALVGVRPESIHKWEHGRAVPYDRNIRRLAEVFGVDPHDIELLGDAEGKEAA
jgi:transcriptional regulator with XRE-family HTH domain